MYHFPETDRMPEVPALPVPDYAKLNREFHNALMDPANKILRFSPNGHPIFGAYIHSDSNELVTWGILAVGEWLAGRSAAWISTTYPDFFVPEIGLYMNSPGADASEFWYLFYVNTLAGAVFDTLFARDAQARERMGSAADAMLRLAQTVHCDFNHQGFLFGKNIPYTNRPEYRQPDSIAGMPTICSLPLSGRIVPISGGKRQSAQAVSSLPGKPVV